MPGVSSHGKQLAATVRDVLGIEPKIRRSTWRGHAADVLVGVDTPHRGVTTLATLNLSEHDRGVDDGVERGFGVELVACHYGDIEGCIDAVFDAAFLSLEHHVEMRPGTVLPDLIGRRGLSGTMKHFLLITPFFWDERLKSLRIGDREVRYLLMVPISDQEMALAGSEGSEALDDVLERTQVDVFDWSRPSVVDRE